MLFFSTTNERERDVNPFDRLSYRRTNAGLDVFEPREQKKIVKSETHKYYHAIFQIDLIAKNLYETNRILVTGRLGENWLTTKGKFSGSRGPAWMRNSSFQFSSDLNDVGDVTSITRTQQSAPR